MIRAQHQARRLEKENKQEANANGASREKGDAFYKNGYITHDAVTAEAMRILTANGIHYQPFVKGYKQDNNRTIVDIEGVFTNVDKPDERLVFPSFGYGVDTSDKGPGKAMSYAKKMNLSQALMLNTHEDIEAANVDYAPAAAPAQIKQAQAETEAAIKSWADAFKHALDACANQKDLKKIRAENAHMMQSPSLPEVTRDYFIAMIAQLESDLP